MLERIGCDIQACGVVLKQGAKWMGVLGEERTSKLVYVLESPLPRAVEGGWDVHPYGRLLQKKGRGTRGILSALVNLTFATYSPKNAQMNLCFIYIFIRSPNLGVFPGK